MLPTIHIPHHFTKREMLPQIPALDSFLSFLKKNDIHYGKEMVSAQHMIPTQGEINLNAVFALLEKGLDTHKYPILLSRENHIIDGHHRWYAGKILEQAICSVKINLGLSSILHVIENLYDAAEYNPIQNVKGII